MQAAPSEAEPSRASASSDTFAPFGLFLATSEEISEAQNLSLWLEVNGSRVQHCNTMWLGYVSQFMTQLPGFEPPRYLRASDVAELGIDRPDRSRQRAVPPA